LRLFAVACCRRAWHLLVDERSRQAVEVAERFADGAASDEELEAVRRVAWEFALHVVHEDEAFFGLGDEALNAADAPAWAAQRPVEAIRAVIALQRALGAGEGPAQADLLRCIAGNPFRPVAGGLVARGSGSNMVIAIAEGAYEERAFDRLPVLADALEDAGCADEQALGHLRGPGTHARGCWVIDRLTGRESG
jgi:hypothetical protein